jgi:hypothetical protein
MGECKFCDMRADDNIKLCQELDRLKAELLEKADAGWHSLRMERDRYRKAMEEIVFECKMGVNHQSIVEDVSNIATGALWEDKP